MLVVRNSSARGQTRLPWLVSRHTFSFDSYYDPEQMGFRTLRVVNEDRVAGGHGFDLHPHRDMEILSFVYSGALEHQDDMGNRGRLEAGDIQLISAGSGIRHAERNPGDDEVHFLQVWILPERQGLPQSYAKTSVAAACRHNCLQLVASPDGRDESLQIHQDCLIYSSILDAGQAMQLTPQSGRHLWLQLIRGELRIDHRQQLKDGDGLAVSDVTELWLEAERETDFLLFELA